MRTPLAIILLLSAGQTAGAQPPSKGKAVGAPGTSPEVVPVSYHVPEGMTTPGHLQFERKYQQGPFCGPNSLYIILRLKGKVVTAADVAKQVPTTSAGSSLADLKAAGEKFGLTSEVRKVTLKEVAALTPPYILHLSTPTAGTPGSADARDHFVVVTSVQPNGELAGVDPNSGHKAVWAGSYLSRNMSGYVLVPEVERPKSVTAWKVVLGGLFVALFAFNVGLVRAVRAGRRPAAG